MRISEPGIYRDIPPEAYHADCVDGISLSRGIAHMLIGQTPRHAHRAHPKLGGVNDIVPTRAMDDGSAIHSLMLGRGGDIEVVNAVYGPKSKRAGQPVADYTTADAQEARDAIRDRGGIPVLPHKIPLLQQCAESALDQLRENQDGAAFFAPGASEAVVVWQEDGLWFRIMIDRLPDDPRAPFYDIKATELSAAPGGWERRLQRIYAFQAAFYERGLRAVRGVQPGPMLFPVVELKEPNCLSVMAAAPSLRQIAEQDVERAIGIWRQCLATDRWPGYPPFTAYVEATSYQVMQAEEQAARDEFALDHAA